MSFTTKHLATLYGKSETTIRNWAIEFADYLSPTATPQSGKNRFYTGEDITVFALVAEMKDQDQTFEQIHLSLKSGQRGDPPDLSQEDIHTLAVSERERRITLEVEALQRTIIQLRQDMREYQEKADQVDEINLENARLKATMEYLKSDLDLNRAQLKEAQQRIEALAKEMGQSYVKGVMDTLREKGDLPKKSE